MPSSSLSRPELGASRLLALAREHLDRRRLKLLAGYLLYALALAALLLYVYFPTAQLKERLEAEYESRLPGQLSIDKARVAFGPALRLEGVSVRDANGPRGSTLFEAEEVVLRPSLWTLLGGAPNIAYRMSVGGGSVSGRLTVSGEAKKKTAVSAELKDVALKRGALLKKLFGLEVAGKMAGKADLELGSALAESRGKLALEVNAGKLSGFDNDAIPLESVKFKKLVFECELGGRKLTIRRADLKDGEMANKLSGVIEVADEPLDSRLELRGNLSFSDYVVRTEELEDELPGGGRRGLPYIISGTLREPRFSLDLGGQRGNGADEDVEEDEDEAATVSAPRRTPPPAAPRAPARRPYPARPASPRGPAAVRGQG